MNIFENIDKNNLHHAYLIEGSREETMQIVLDFVESIEVKTSNNPDFTSISVDTFKVKDALVLRDMGGQKSFTTGKKIFVVYANSFIIEAQNLLLKMFEEPIENTHFFIIVPSTDSLLKTLISRFYLIRSDLNLKNEIKEAEKFIAMPMTARINFLKEMLVSPDKEDDEEESEEVVSLDSTRAKALKFLNALEVVISSSLKDSSASSFEHIFKVREFLRQPGSSAKMMMESVALILPKF
ncbi:hypothetical protein K8Q94_01145 [Candidatus Nomurabacteria bacterium]|nr:hypothetical protein [Candidatus Nomurabacteria bacterium]